MSCKTQNGSRQFLGFVASSCVHVQYKSYAHNVRHRLGHGTITRNTIEFWVRGVCWSTLNDNYLRTCCFRIGPVRTPPARAIRPRTPRRLGRPGRSARRPRRGPSRSRESSRCPRGPEKKEKKEKINARENPHFLQYAGPCAGEATFRDSKFS